MELPYTQLSAGEIRSQINQHIRNAEATHLQKLIDVTINEECAKLAEAAGKKQQAASYKEAAAQLRREADAFLAGVKVLQERYKSVLEEAAKPDEVDVPPARIR